MKDFFKENLSKYMNGKEQIQVALQNHTPQSNSDVVYDEQLESIFYIKNEHKYFLHSRFDKEEEALEKTSVINYDMKKVIFVIGLGEGHHIRAIQRQMADDCSLIIIEPELDILYYSHKYFDLGDIISNKNTYVLQFQSRSFVEILEKVITAVIVKISSFDIYYLETSRNRQKDIYENIKQIILDNIILVRKKIGNSPLDSMMGLEHLLRNIEHIVKSGDYSNQTETGFEDVPIVSVASGPSINKNIHLLHQIKDKALIICCDSVYDRLVREGITPHIITVLERDKGIYDLLFTGRNIPANIMLIGEGIIYPQIFDCFSGRKITVFRDLVRFESWGADNANATKQTIGPSVAHLNLILAKLLKCKCLILIGQDLAYGEDGNSHASGTIHEKNYIQDDMNRGEDIEYVEDINGNMVKTTSIWKYFLTWMNESIKNMNFPVIDATEGGAKIDNTEIISFQAAIDKYCKSSFNIEEKLRDFFKELDEEEVSKNFRKFSNAFNEENKNIKAIRDIISKNIKRIERLNTDREFTPEYINKNVIPINKDINTLVDRFKIFYQITQSKFVGLGNLNSKLSYITDENVCEWKEAHLEFFYQLGIYCDLYEKIFENGEKILSNLEGTYV